MARLHTSGGEIRDHSTTDIGSPDGYTAGAAATTTSTSVYRSGSASVQCAGTSANTSYRIWPFTAPSAGTTLFARAYIRFTALPNATKKVLQFGTAALSSVRLTSAGKLQLWTTAQVGSDSTMTLAVDTWYRVELKQTIGAGAVDAVELRVQLDGAESINEVETVASGSSLTISDTQPVQLHVGWIEAPGVTSTLYVDDVALNDSTGTKQNTWCGRAQVLLSKAARVESSFQWGTCGIGALGPGDVNATPPVGHATATVAGHSRHQAVCAATSGLEYTEMACQDYASAGVVGNVFEDQLGAVSFSNTTHIGRPYAMLTAGPRVAQSFKLNGTLQRIDVPLFRVGSPADDVVIELQGDAAGLPDGTVLESITITGSSISTSAWDWRSLDIPFRVLTTATPHWIVARRTGANDSTNYYGWAWIDASAAGTYEGGVGKVYDGAAWQNAATDHGFRALTTEGAIRLAVIVPALCHAEEVSTGTKTGTFSVVRHPAISSSTFTYGNDVGAAGAYPTNWRWKTIGPAYEVNFSSAGPAPSLKFVKTDTGSRYVLVCFAGVYIEVKPLDPGWRQVTKTADSTLWWVEQASVTTTTMIDDGSVVTCESGDWWLTPDPMPEEGNLLTLTTISTATLQASYTGW